jgi:hypothetical protein
MTRKFLQTTRPVLCLWLAIKIALVKFLFGWIQERTQGYSTAQNFKALHYILNMIYSKYNNYLNLRALEM